MKVPLTYNEYTIEHYQNKLTNNRFGTRSPALTKTSSPQSTETPAQTSENEIWNPEITKTIKNYCSEREMIEEKTPQ